MTDYEIAISADLPEVTEVPTRIEVRCGETSVSVHEHGVKGSGSWAVWIGQGHTVGPDGDKYLDSPAKALERARAYVRREELRRLMYAELSGALARIDRPIDRPINNEEVS